MTGEMSKPWALFPWQARRKTRPIATVLSASSVQTKLYVAWELSIFVMAKGSYAFVVAT